MVIDNVVVTITCEGRDFDMELPANVKISQIKPVLRDALIKKGIGLPDNFSLLSSAGYLDESCSLLDAGVWDGRTITIGGK